MYCEAGGEARLGSVNDFRVTVVLVVGSSLGHWLSLAGNMII